MRTRVKSHIRKRKGKRTRIKAHSRNYSSSKWKKVKLQEEELPEDFLEKISEYMEEDRYNPSLILHDGKYDAEWEHQQRLRKQTHPTLIDTKKAETAFRKTFGSGNFMGGFPLATKPTGRPKLSPQRISEMDKMMDELHSAEIELETAKSMGDTEAIESLGKFTRGIKMRLVEPEKIEGFSFGSHPQTGRYEPGKEFENIFFERTKRQKVKNG